MRGVLLKDDLNLKNMDLYALFLKKNEMLSFTRDFLKNLDLNNADLYV